MKTLFLLAMIAVVGGTLSLGSVAHADQQSGFSKVVDFDDEPVPSDDPVPEDSGEGDDSGDDL